MKILYAVQGTGNGHLARAGDVIPRLNLGIIFMMKAIKTLALRTDPVAAKRRIGFLPQKAPLHLVHRADDGLARGPHDQRFVELRAGGRTQLAIGTGL